MRVKLCHLADKQEWTHHKHRVQEDTTLQDLESLLNSKIGQKAFLWFLQSEFSEENLQFWLACEEYRVTPPWQQGAKAQSMYCQYINPGSPQEEAPLRVMEEPAGDIPRRPNNTPTT
ncbi:regulator of G-protein signaling 16-like [Oncorhynchus keta]|uniref:regulator of G-protein signaling 16-like n=1 Tax=Oncorhynchus keta TaxID=8018 RepID=UPI00227AD4D6|nr:regulator of G-protein signaling 16-like [Oncorhynchus keta]